MEKVNILVSTDRKKWISIIVSQGFHPRSLAACSSIRQPSLPTFANYFFNPLLCRIPCPLGSSDSQQPDPPLYLKLDHSEPPIGFLAILRRKNSLAFLYRKQCMDEQILRAAIFKNTDEQQLLFKN